MLFSRCYTLLQLTETTVLICQIGWPKAYSSSSHTRINDKAVVLSELAECCWNAIEEIGRSGR